MKKKNTYRRRPNNTGTVIKLSGNRRKPYAAKITTGYDPISGLQLQKPIGYFETREEALEALALHSMAERKALDKGTLSTLGGNTYDQIMEMKNKNLPTFADLYEQVTVKLFESVSNSRTAAYNSAFKRLNRLHDKKINTITLFDLQETIDLSKPEVKQKVLSDMKTICIKVFEYAVIHQYISRDADFTSYIDTKQTDKESDNSSKHKTFSIEEIRKLFEDGSIEAKIVLAYIFTGCRPNELLNLSSSAIHIDELSNDNGKEQLISYIITGSKTAAGKGRCIPIHNLIRPFIKETIKELSSYKNPKSVRYDVFDPLMKKMKMDHLPYDTRHTFATLAKLNKVDEFCRKRIMGHKADNLTDDVYTHTIYNQLYNEIQKIKV